MKSGISQFFKLESNLVSDKVFVDAIKLILFAYNNFSSL